MGMRQRWTFHLTGGSRRTSVHLPFWDNWCTVWAPRGFDNLIIHPLVRRSLSAWLGFYGYTFDNCNDVFGDM